MSDYIEMCLDVKPINKSDDDLEKVASSESPSNSPKPLGLVPARSALELAGLKRKLWRIGRTISVSFMDGDDFLKGKAMEFAKEWENFANITFDFGTDPNSDIRITFNRGGSWSYIGTDCLLIDKNEPTMQFGWFTGNTRDDEFSRTTIHEFGHALGMIHEHQSPGVEIPWDKPAVYRYYERTQGWSEEDVDNNLFAKYSSSETQFSKFDKESIMLYSIDNSLTIGNFEVGWNRDLSDTDKSFIAKIYPG